MQQHRVEGRHMREAMREDEQLLQPGPGSIGQRASDEIVQGAPRLVREELYLCAQSGEGTVALVR